MTLLQHERLVLVALNGFYVSVRPARRWYRFAVRLVPFKVWAGRS